MPTSLTFAATCIAIITSFMVIGNLIEKKIDQKQRKHISKIIWHNIWKEKRLDVSRYFILLFDVVFDTNHKGRPSFIRSILVSSSLLTVMLAIWILSDRFDLEDALLEDVSFLLLLGISVISTNFLGDFVSIWETRIVINKMTKSSSFGVIINWIFLDFILTYLIYMTGIICATAMFFTLTSFFPVTGSAVTAPRSVVTLVMLAGGFVIFTPHGSALDVFSFVFFTTMLTSIWLWSLMIAAIISAALVSACRKVRGLAGVIDIEHHPIFWMMTVCGVIFSGLVSLPAVVQPMQSLLSNLIARLTS